jgi:tetratricopeptide (TPR) repeat protein
MVNFLLRWSLPITLVLAAIPVAPQSFVARPADISSPDVTENIPVSATTPPDIVTQPPQSTLTLTPEQQGDRLEASHRYQAAIEAYAQIPVPTASVWNRMGIAYQMLFDLNDAVRCYKESLKLEPTNADALNNLGTAQDLENNHSAAERSFRAAVKLDPRNALAFRNLGTNLLTQQQYDKAADAYRQALALNPHIFDVTYGPKAEAQGAGKTLGAANYIKARSCARAGLTDCALAYLERAFHEGSATVRRVNADQDFATLRGTPALARLFADQK